MIWTLNGVHIEVVKEHVDFWDCFYLKHKRQNISGLYPPSLHHKKGSGNWVLSPKMMCRLFDTLTRPSLTYGSEVWGVELGPLDHDKSGTVANSVEKVHLQYLKRIIGV
jgi:hypothetical protein